MGNISLVRVGGVCAILAVVSGTMARIAFGNEWLKSRGVDTLITGHWFDTLGVLLFMVAAWGWPLHRTAAPTCSSGRDDPCGRSRTQGSVLDPQRVDS